MKKSLLSILAGALLVVGCQNYDDQFDALESQINALASTVAGLSQVQSDLSSLAGQVNSIQSSIDSSVQTALASGLADIDAAIETLNAAAESASSNSDIAQIATGVAENQDALAELLAQSSVFQSDVVINSIATLDVYHAIGDGLAIVNGNVTIDAKADMDATKLQETVDFIKTTTGNFSYVAANSSTATVTFLELTGTQSLTITQPGDYRFDNLGSATNIVLGDKFKSKVNIIHFGALTSVSKFYTDTASPNLIDFNKATELHLTSLVHYPPNNLTMRIDDEDNSVIALAIDDVDATGAQSNITLDIEGPNSVSLSNLKDGSLTFTNVNNVTVNGFEGAFTIKNGVENFTADKVTALTLSGATQLTTVDITGALDPDVTTDKTGPGLSIDGNSSLESVTLAGKMDDVTLKNDPNLTTVVVTAEIDGILDLESNVNLENITLTGGSATGVDLNGNTNLEAVTIDITYIAGTATDAKLDGSLTVVDNTNLESLTVSSDKIETLTITGNDALEVVDFTGLAAFGATGKPTVKIWDNDLELTMTDTSDGDTNVANGATGDLGTITGASGIETIKTYLTAVVADADSTVEVFGDSVDFTDESNNTNSYAWGAATTAANASEYLRVAYKVPNSAAAAKAGTKQKRAFLIGYWDPDAANNKFEIWANGTRINSTNIRVDANPALTVANILTADNIARATAAGVTIGASVTGNASTTLSVFSSANSTTNEWSGGTTDTSVSSATVFSLTVGSLTVTTSISTPKITKDPGEILSVIVAAYEAVTATVEEVTFTKGTDTDAESTYAVVARDKGSDGSGINIALTASTGKHSDTATHGTGTFGLKIGATRLTTDNSTVGQDIVITIEDNDVGAILNSIGAVSADQASATIRIGTTDLLSTTKAQQTAAGSNYELTSTLLTVSSTAPANNNTTFPTESRGDVRIAEDGVAAAASNATNYSRVGWL